MQIVVTGASEQPCLTWKVTAEQLTDAATGARAGARLAFSRRVLEQVRHGRAGQDRSTSTDRRSDKRRVRHYNRMRCRSLSFL